MKVKIQTGFLEQKEYFLSIKEKCLIFYTENREDEIKIPLSQLSLFSLVKTPQGSERFYIETPSKNYEGRFLSREDSISMIEQLNALGYRVETILTAE